MPTASTAATNPTYSRGVQAGRVSQDGGQGATTVRAHRPVWFDAEGIGSVCQVVSISEAHRQTPAFVEGVGMYVITKTGHPAAQELCNLLTDEAAKVLDRLGLH
jgi:hypothetical protein